MLAAATCGWVLAVATGIGMAWRYEDTPGSPGGPPQTWPAESHVTRLAGRPTLLLLAHPHCPCTRASLGELARIMTRCPGVARAHVLFVKPPGLPRDWVETDLWRAAAAIPGTEVSCDDGGREARLFHAATSGQTLLYGEDGRLLFAGGITGARGHAGDNDGRSAIVSLLTEKTTSLAKTRVFGCSLCNPGGLAPGDPAATVPSSSEPSARGRNACRK